METQILHFEADAWRPYSYVWNDDQTDAVLADAGGATQTIVHDTCRAVGAKLNYRVHARTECVLCHNPWVEKKTTIFGVQSASPLGVNTPQLNKQRDDGEVVGQPAHDLAPDGPSGLDARPRQAAEARRSLRRVGRPRPPGAVVSANQLRPLPPVRTRVARPISRWATTCRWSRPRPSTSGRSRGRSTSPEPGSSRPAIPRARCCITGFPSSAAAACRGSAPTRSTSVRPG